MRGNADYLSSKEIIDMQLRCATTGPISFLEAPAPLRNCFPPPRLPHLLQGLYQSFETAFLEVLLLSTRKLPARGSVSLLEAPVHVRGTISLLEVDDDPALLGTFEPTRTYGPWQTQEAFSLESLVSEPQSFRITLR